MKNKKLLVLTEIWLIRPNYVEFKIFNPTNAACYSMFYTNEEICVNFLFSFGQYTVQQVLNGCQRAYYEMASTDSH